MLFTDRYHQIQNVDANPRKENMELDNVATVVFLMIGGIVYAFGVFVHMSNLNIDHGEKNIVRLAFYGVCWPYFFMARIVRDAKRLLPKKPAPPAVKNPHPVTVEMLAADKGKEYEPGQWIN